MRLLLALIFTTTSITAAYASDTNTEEPIQHRIVEEVTSAEDAERIFLDETAKIAAMKVLDEAELHEIHMITYSLEKAVEYFTLNLDGEKQDLAKEIAVVVENIHLDSENNRKEETQTELTRFFELAEEFRANF